jgi:hypothetical protein
VGCVADCVGWGTGVHSIRWIATAEGDGQEPTGDFCQLTHLRQSSRTILCGIQQQQSSSRLRFLLIYSYQLSKGPAAKYVAVCTAGWQRLLLALEPHVSQTPRASHSVQSFLGFDQTLLGSRLFLLYQYATAA